MTSPAQPTIADAVRLMDSLTISNGEPSKTLGTIDALEALTSSHSPTNGTPHSLDTGRTPVIGSSTPEGASRIPSLPAEIILLIGTHLLDPPKSSSSFPCCHSASLPSFSSFSSTGLSSLLTLSSTSLSFRSTLVPLIWHTIHITTPQHLPRLCTLLNSYNSPTRKLRHPLPFIRSIKVSIPEKYLDLDQIFLLTLLRSMDLGRTKQLEHLSWSAEVPPSSAIWGLVGGCLRSLEVDGRCWYVGEGGWGKLERLEVCRVVGYESTLLPRGVVSLLQAQGGLGPKDNEEDEGRRQEAKPLAEHSKRTRLKHLSLPSSKTSLFHQPALIPHFSGLTCLDIYPITPLSPTFLSSLLTTSSTLTHLRLILDISGAFSDFNLLWLSLTGKLDKLVWLEVDPMPQQNTAPSFGAFVEGCGRLKWINGRDKGGYPPCFGGFDPDNSSGALPF